MRYRVSHRTTYSYSKPVQDSVGLFHLIPRELPWQQVLASDVEVVPCPYPEAARPESPFWGRVVDGAALMWESM